MTDVKVVTICGSMRFFDKMAENALKLETDKGYCVLQPVYSLQGQVLNDAELQNIKKLITKKSICRTQYSW